MNKIQWNFIPSKKTFCHKNASEKNVCGMSAILSRGDELNDLKKIYTT